MNPGDLALVFLKLILLVAVDFGFHGKFFLGLLFVLDQLPPRAWPRHRLANSINVGRGSRPP